MSRPTRRNNQSTDNASHTDNDEREKSAQNRAYFNNAGKTRLPATVEQAGIQAVHNECHPDFSNATEHTTHVRQLFSQIIGAKNDGSEICICPSTGFALTMVSRNLHRTGVIAGTGDSILVLQDQMSSGVYCWQDVCATSGATLNVVDHPTGDGGWTEAIVAMIRQWGRGGDDDNDDTGRIKVVCVPQVHWSDGSYIDLKSVGDACRERGIIFVVDGTQSVGVMPFDVREIGCDVLACSVHKWLLGPHGMCLMYIDEKYHNDWLPLDQHERSRAIFQNDEFDAMQNGISAVGYPSDFVAGAARCDSGGKKNPILMPMVHEGLKIVSKLNFDKVQEQLRPIAEGILKGGKELGFGVQPGPRASHIIGLRPHSEELCRILTPSNMVELVRRLEKRGVHIAVRSGALRIAPYLDTSQEDVEQLLEAIAEECVYFKRSMSHINYDVINR